MMKSADHQVRSLLDVISFILESLSASEAQTFETEIFSEYFRKHFNLLDKKNRDFQDSCSVAKTKELDDAKDTAGKVNALHSILPQKVQSPLPPSQVDQEVSSSKDKPMIITEKSLNDSFICQLDMTVSPDSLSPIPLHKEKNKTSKDLPFTGKIIIFDPFADNGDLDEYDEDDEEVEEEEDKLKEGNEISCIDEEKSREDLVITSNDEDENRRLANIDIETTVEEEEEEEEEKESNEPLQITNQMTGIMKNKYTVEELGIGKKRKLNEIHQKDVIKVQKDKIKVRLFSYQDLQTTAKVQPFQCSICETEFNLKSELSEHSRDNHEKLLCAHDGKCTFAAENQEGVDEHVDAVHKILNIKETFQCPHCDDNFTAQALVCHVKREHVPHLDFRTCPLCLKTVDRRNEHTAVLEQSEWKLNYHIEKHHSKLVKQDCKVCGKKGFSTLRSFKIHLEKRHTGAIRKMLYCEICDKKLIDGEGYKRHMDAHNATGKIYPCGQCDKKYPTKAKRTQHVSAMHKGDNLLCTECDYRTKSKMAFERHLIKHLDERPFSCEHCDLRFKSKDTLRNHQLVHTGEKKHECSACGKKFKRVVHLRTHERIHQDKSEAYCNLCDKHFIQSYNYKLHVRKRHMNELDKRQDDPHLKEEQLN